MLLKTENVIYGAEALKFRDKVYPATEAVQKLIQSRSEALSKLTTSFNQDCAKLLERYEKDYHTVNQEFEDRISKVS